jgi:hypothetical protein
MTTELELEDSRENTNVIYWRFARSYEGRTDFLDPRLAIAKQIGWRKGINSSTEFSVPEPDNFNRAIVCAKWIECEFLEDQVMFYDRVRKSYISCYYVPLKQIKQFDAWVKTLAPIGVWYHTNPPKIKERKSI